jgi:hypothetical protein
VVSVRAAGLPAVGPPYTYCCFSVGYNSCGVVAQFVSLPTAAFKVGGRLADACTEDDLERGKRRLVRPLPFHPISGTSNSHFGNQESCFVGEGESVVGRELRNRGVAEVAVDGAPQVVKLLFARRVRFNAIFGQQFFPCHWVYLR